jgi:glucose-1-phosphate thymidylyltransferase
MSNSSTSDMVGIIPAAGMAKRLGRLSSSKEVIPIYTFDKANNIQVLSEHLISHYRTAGIDKVMFILRKGKWDIPEFYGNGSAWEMNFSYLIMQYPYGIPFTIYEALPFAKNSIVALGFPDMIMEPNNVYVHLIDKVNLTNSDVVLGLFPIQNSAKWDMVALDQYQNITDIVIKEKRDDLKFGWSAAVWNNEFSEYLHSHIKNILIQGSDGRIMGKDKQLRELYPGDIFLNAIRDGLKVSNVIFEDGTCTDLGTIDDLHQYLKHSL